MLMHATLMQGCTQLGRHTRQSLGTLLRRQEDTPTLPDLLEEADRLHKGLPEERESSNVNGAI